METIRGKTSWDISFAQFRKRLAGYNRILLDLGTGDGRYVHALAKQNPDWFTIGIDSCRENLRERSHMDLPNMLFVIAEAQHLPMELAGLASGLTINFPWGSLLEGLLIADPALINGLASIARPGASVELRLNADALAEAGSMFEAGADQIRGSLLQWGWLTEPPRPIHPSVLRAFPSTWARRLAFGRDPRALLISGRLTNRTLPAQ